jgi:hypothetical protein
MELLRIWRKVRFLFAGILTAVVIIYGLRFPPDIGMRILYGQWIPATMMQAVLLIGWISMDIIFLEDVLTDYLEPTNEMKVRGIRSRRYFFRNAAICIAAFVLKDLIVMCLCLHQYSVSLSALHILLYLASFLLCHIVFQETRDHAVIASIIMITAMRLLLPLLQR